MYFQSGGHHQWCGIEFNNTACHTGKEDQEREANAGFGNITHATVSSSSLPFLIAFFLTLPSGSNLFAIDYLKANPSTTAAE
jgi:hypothetical protein